MVRKFLNTSLLTSNFLFIRKNRAVVIAYVGGFYAWSFSLNYCSLWWKKGCEEQNRYKYSDDILYQFFSPPSPPPLLHLTQKKLACMFVESVSSFKSKSIQNLDIEKWQRRYFHFCYFTSFAPFFTLLWWWYELWYG